PPGSLSISQFPAAGTLVGLGPHTITVTATDPSRNSATCSTLFTVADTTAPVIVSGPVLADIPADANCQGVVPSVVSEIVATDNCTPANALLISQDPAAGSLVGLGQHTIIVTVADASGNSTAGSLSFAVVDKTPPVIVSAPTSLTVSADANCQAAVPNVLANVVGTDSCTPATQ